MYAESLISDFLLFRVFLEKLRFLYIFREYILIVHKVSSLITVPAEIKFTFFNILSFIFAESINLAILAVLIILGTELCRTAALLHKVFKFGF